MSRWHLPSAIDRRHLSRLLIDLDLDWFMYNAYKYEIKFPDASKND